MLADAHISSLGYLWFQALGIVGRKKERGARERHTYLLARTFFIAPYFEVPATQLYVLLFSSSTIGNPRSYL